MPSAALGDASPPRRLRDAVLRSVVRANLPPSLARLEPVLAYLGELPPQVAKLVSQLRGVLEAQVVGGCRHLLLQLDGHPLELVLRDLLRLGGAGSPRAPPAARNLRLGLEELGDVGNALDDGRGRDPVSLVVAQLDLAPA